jgi:hypothetical protein
MTRQLGQRAVALGNVAEVQRLRREAAEILEDCCSMARDLVRIGDASDWTDPSLVARELTIRRWEEVREALLACAKEIERGHAA